MKWSLVASSATKEGIEKLVNKYFYSEGYRITEELDIVHDTKTPSDKFRIKKTKSRYRFEFNPEGRKER